LISSKYPQTLPGLHPVQCPLGVQQGHRALLAAGIHLYRNIRLH